MRWTVFEPVSSVLRTFVDTKENLYATTAVVAYMFSFVSTNTATLLSHGRVAGNKCLVQKELATASSKGGVTSV